MVQAVVGSNPIAHPSKRRWGSAFPAAREEGAPTSSPPSHSTTIPAAVAVSEPPDRLVPGTAPARRPRRWPIGRRSAARAARLGLTIVGVALVWAGISPARTGLYEPPACQTVTFHSEPQLTPQRVCMNLGVRTHATGSGTYLFLTPGYAGLGIFKDDGTLVWWHPLPAGTPLEDNLSVVRLWGHAYRAAWAGGAQSVGRSSGGKFYINEGSVLLFDHHYRQVGTITAGAPFSPDRIDMHEFRITPQGDALIGIDDPVKQKVHGHVVTVLQYVVQKLSITRASDGSIHTGRVLFQWNSLQHVPVTASHAPDPGPGKVWDYFHGNSIAQDTDGNLIVSSRNTWGIYKIDVRTGRVIWQVGAPGESHLRHPWCYQHDVSPLGGGEYSVYDDGGLGYGCYSNGTWHPSRGVIFRVIGHPARVQLTGSYSHRPSIHSAYLGSTESLPGGEVLVDWGDIAAITQYSRSGRVLMDLSLSRYSYRGFRFRWVGLPSAPPSAAAEFRSGGTQVWVSWNGSTEVAAWQVLGGATESTLAPVGRPANKTGFETSIDLVGHQWPFVAVRALNSRGQVLGTSRTVTPGLAR